MRTASTYGTGSRNARGGFTLLELLVASAAGILLLIVLVTAFQNTLSSYSLVQGGVTRQGDAALAMDQLVQDLEGLVIPNLASAEALRATPETVEASATQWLTFLTTATDRDDSDVPFSGATRAVSYRMAFQNPIDGGKNEAVYGLYRSVAPAQKTFNDVIAAAKADHQKYFWKDLVAGATKPFAPTATDSFLAANVVRFQVRFQRADNGAWTEPDDAIRIASDGTTVNGVEVPGGFRRAEASITVLTPEGAERAKNASDFEAVVKRHGRTYVRQTAFAF